jgi:hypothetical protein
MSTSGCSHQLRLFFRRAIRLRRRYNKTIGQTVIDANQNQLKSKLTNCDNNCNQNENRDPFRRPFRRLHRKTRSLNDICLYVDELDTNNESSPKFSKFKRTRSQLSGVSFRRKLRLKKMGQNSSANFDNTPSSGSSGGLTIKMEKHKDSSISGNNEQN